MRFNINHNIRVKVQPRGIALLERDGPAYMLAKIDAEGYLVEQAWVIMNTFGPYMGNGFDSPIETEIQILAKDLMPEPQPWNAISEKPSKKSAGTGTEPTPSKSTGDSGLSSTET